MSQSYHLGLAASWLVSIAGSWFLEMYWCFPVEVGLFFYHAHKFWEGKE